MSIAPSIWLREQSSVSRAPAAGGARASVWAQPRHDVGAGGGRPSVWAQLPSSPVFAQATSVRELSEAQQLRELPVLAKVLVALAAGGAGYVLVRAVRGERPREKVVPIKKPWWKL